MVRRQLEPTRSSVKPIASVAHLENEKKETPAFIGLLRINPIIEESLTFACHIIIIIVVVAAVGVGVTSTSPRRSLVRIPHREGEPLRNGPEVPFVYVIRSPRNSPGTVFDN